MENISPDKLFFETLRLQIYHFLQNNTSVNIEQSTRTQVHRSFQVCTYEALFLLTYLRLATATAVYRGTKLLISKTVDNSSVFFEDLGNSD